MLDYYKVFRSNSWQMSSQLHAHPAMAHSKMVSPLNGWPVAVSGSG